MVVSDDPVSPIADTSLLLEPFAQIEMRDMQYSTESGQQTVDARRARPDPKNPIVLLTLCLPTHHHFRSSTKARDSGTCGCRPASCA
jgi:hypothetical protein